MKFAVVCSFATLSAACLAQTPSFDVASIRPFTEGETIQITVDHARLIIRGYYLRQIIEYAYQIKGDQLFPPGSPDSKRLDITAIFPEGVSNDKVPTMLQALLAERFKLATHREMRELPVYALVVGKGGVTFKEAPPNVDLSHGFIKSYGRGGVMHQDYLSANMDMFAEHLRNYLDRPTVN